MRALGVAAALLAIVLPASAHATCESGFLVNSREIEFSYYDVMPTNIDEFSTPAQRVHFRGLAHALAVAQACFDSARIHTCEAGTPPRTKLQLLPGGRLEPVDTSDFMAIDLVRSCARADGDSACTLWTCEIGRFRTEESAQELADGVAIASDPEVFEATWLRSRDATIAYVSCAGGWDPWSFVVRLSGGVAPWATRMGLFFTREDAEREAARWVEAVGRRPRIVRQRVNGALLEQALRQPIEGC